MTEEERKDNAKSLLKRTLDAVRCLEECLFSLNANISHLRSESMNEKMTCDLYVVYNNLRDMTPKWGQLFRRGYAVYNPKSAELPPFEWATLKGLEGSNAGRPRYPLSLLQIIQEAVKDKRRAKEILKALQQGFTQCSHKSKRDRNKEQFSAIWRAFECGYLGKNIPPYNVFADAIQGLMPERTFYRYKKQAEQGQS